MMADLIIGLGALVLGILLIAVGIQGMRRKRGQENKHSVKQEDVHLIMNRINDALEELGYEAVGYDNTRGFMTVIVEKI